MPRMERCASREDGNQRSVRGEASARWLWYGSSKRLTPRPSYKGVSLVARELATFPMMLFARRFEDTLDVTVQCCHDTDPSEHGRAFRRDRIKGCIAARHFGASRSAFGSFVM
jgi:hypothetical protein